jgi:hypothetical protein
MENSSKENTRIIKEYCECGGHWLVEVLSTRTVGNFEYIKLKCIETIRLGPKPNIEDGAEFEVGRAVGYDGWFGWSLLDVK